MAITDVVTFALSFSPAALLSILIAALGLGLVIFVHELGHFLVAKWCGVYVERFSIGLMHPIYSRKWGETEYAIGWLPFGGYVKMLGQDDIDPAAMTDEETARDPRSYTAKNVPQRMAIISAGVIMNMITGMLFFVIAFSLGIMKIDRTVGRVQVGMPAWIHGIRSGDTITRINNRQVEDFDDILRGTTLSRGAITVAGYRKNGDTFELTMTPRKDDKDAIRRMIGIAWSDSLTLIGAEGSGLDPAWPGTSAAQADFLPGDTIVSLDGQAVEDSQQLLSLFNTHRDQTVQVHVERHPDNSGQRATATVPLAPQNFMGLGLRMGMGRIVAIRDGSPAAKAGFLAGDRIATVNGQDVGNDLDPFRLSELFSEHAGEDVSVTVTREVAGGLAPETLTFQLTPEAIDPWSEPPLAPESPLSIPSIGVAYHLVPTVFSVREGSVGEAAKIAPRDVILKMAFLRDPSLPRSKNPEELSEIKIEEKNWGFAFWMMQEAYRSQKVQLTIKPANSSEEQVVEIQPEAVDGWYMPTARGLRFASLRTERKAESLGQAFGMGIRYTISCVEDIYLLLRGLFTRDMSPKVLSGPIGIAKNAYEFAEMGFAYFMLFLGVISVNLAVINFLPIPLLDGGHMMFLLWEGIFRRKPSEKVIIAATWCGLLVVASLFVFVIYLDLFVSRH